ncbi:unnamed protein product [Auanema sp. JU1783]|nr:unnamed protein product [Auanema sp. JU1783]
MEIGRACTAEPPSAEMNQSKSSITVVIARNPPDVYNNCPKYPVFDPSFNCPFPGWCLEILKMMTDYLNLQIEPILSPNAIGALNWGTYENNRTWTGVLGYLANGTADTACLLYQRTDLREQHFDLSYPVINVQPIYVVRRRVENIGSVLWNAFKPYSTETWLVLLGSLIFQILIMIFISRVEFLMGKRKRFRPLEMVWNAVQLQLDEKSDDMTFFSIAGNIVLFMFSLLQAGFFIYLYEGLLLSALLRGGEKDPFKDADGVIKLISEGKYHLTTNYIGNWYFDELYNSNASHFVSLRKAIEFNPVVVASSVSEALDLVEKGNHIFPIQEDSVALQMSRQRCNLVYINEGLPQRSAHLAFSNDSYFLEMFNNAIIMQTSFIHRTFSKYFLEGFKLDTLPKCDDAEFGTPKAKKALDLPSVIGCFTLGGLGFLISIGGFMSEVYVYWHRKMVARHRRNRKAFADVGNLLGLAKVHFEAPKKDNINLVNLAKIRISQDSQNGFDAEWTKF